MDKDLKKLLEAAEAQGYEVRWHPKTGHPLVYREGRKITTFAGSPSDYRSFLNSLAPLKRDGFVPPNAKNQKKKGER